jgi:hypothetical protein
MAWLRLWIESQWERRGKKKKGKPPPSMEKLRSGVGSEGSEVGIRSRTSDRKVMSSPPARSEDDRPKLGHKSWVRLLHVLNSIPTGHLTVCPWAGHFAPHCPCGLTPPLNRVGSMTIKKLSYVINAHIEHINQSINQSIRLAMRNCFLFILFFKENQRQCKMWFLTLTGWHSWTVWARKLRLDSFSTSLQALSISHYFF